MPAEVAGLFQWHNIWFCIRTPSQWQKQMEVYSGPVRTVYPNPGGECY